jgi:hypothetical protein
MPIDLTAFNGVDTSHDPDVTTSLHDKEFYSRQRGQNPINGGAQLLLWSPEDPGKSPNPNTAVPPPDLSSTTSNLKEWPLNHSLGLLNDPFGAPQATPEAGDPAQPFPWLTWNNRPYVSPLELMQVPWVPSSQLLLKFTVAAAGDDPYTDPSKPFSHLTNFFVSGASGTPDEELHRVLEYLRVPSPFVGTEIWANPTAASGNPGTHSFHPPFNQISAYREPGRINLNTIYTPEVFYGLMAGYPGMATYTCWSTFAQSRRIEGGDVLALTSGFPTEFPRPFRSYTGWNLTPSAAVPGMKPTHEIDCTLLRSDPPVGGNQPLFQYTPSTAEFNNGNHNPYFRYQSLQRLGNLVTTRSNVYAVWITVGYFEVTPRPTDRKHSDGSDWTAAQYQAVYPDGYQLGRELGMDTGEIERHRAFYIFDRTIPVGFQRGQDLNVEKAILVKRFIE